MNNVYNRCIFVIVASLLIWTAGGCLPGGESRVDGEDTDVHWDAVDTGDADAGSDDTSDPEDSSDPDVTSDTGDSSDTEDTTDEDTGPTDPCEGVTCGANASCEDGQCICDAGFAGDPDQGCDPIETDPCDGVQCPYGATCVGGNCPCDPGFSDDGSGGCEVVPVGDPSARTQQQVCQRWNDDHSGSPAGLWTIEPQDQCDPGVLNPQQQRNALRRLNLYRWLTGLDPVSSKPSYVEMTQECATTLDAYGSITHSIESDFPCYTQDAATAAGSSNLAQGVSTPAASVGLYIDDRGVTSLGHRRWCLNPTMSATGFGQRGRTSCMWSFDRSGSSNVEHVFWPSEGYVPRAALPRTWSMGSNSVGFSSDITVTIEPVGGGDPIGVSNAQRLRSGYALNTISWDVSIRDMQDGTEYEVTIQGAGDTPITYRVTPVSC